MKSIVSYPDRGQGGRNSYRGNCSPRMIEDIIEQYQIHGLSDYMVGSGTIEDVCKKAGVAGTFLDLNRGFDMMTMDIPERPDQYLLASSVRRYRRVFGRNVSSTGYYQSLWI